MPRKSRRKADIKAGKMNKQRKRPAGVTVICIFGFVSAILELLLGVMFIAFAPYLSSFVGPEFGSAAGLEAAFIAIGVSLVIFSIIGMLAFYFLWKMRSAGFILLNVYGIMSVLSTILFFNLLFAAAEIIVWAVVLGYIWKKKNLFAE